MFNNFKEAQEKFLEDRGLDTKTTTMQDIAEAFHEDATNYNKYVVIGLVFFICLALYNLLDVAHV